ncbi:MAG: flagellar export protein FliJ [Desulfobulbaceae bacterium]|jgi:flagellar FliJ protein|nr:flagellar export protein FliJ [Desulfobulbaceae bacterium]
MIKPFSLHTVLDYRGRLENLARQKLMTAEQAVRQLADEIAEVEAEIEERSAALAAKQHQGIDISEHIQLEEGLEYRRRQLTTLKDGMATLLENVENARGHLQKRSQEKKIMEKLKDRQNTAWRQHLDKKEAAQLDEIAILYHGKK